MFQPFRSLLAVQHTIVVPDEPTENSDRNGGNRKKVTVKTIDCGKRTEQKKGANKCASRNDEGLSKAGSWACSRCTFVNKLSANACEMCGRKPLCDASRTKTTTGLPSHKPPCRTAAPDPASDSAADSSPHLRKTDTDPELRRALAAEWGWHFADFLVQTKQHLRHGDTHHTKNALSHQMKSDDLITILNSSEQLSQLHERQVKITGKLATCQESNSRKALDFLLKDVQKAIAKRQTDCQQQRARVPLQNKANTLSQVMK